jgi:hypothetical protein
MIIIIIPRRHPSETDPRQSCRLKPSSQHSDRPGQTPEISSCIFMHFFSDRNADAESMSNHRCKLPATATGTVHPTSASLTDRKANLYYLAGQRQKSQLVLFGGPATEKPTCKYALFDSKPGHREKADPSKTTPIKQSKHRKQEKFFACCSALPQSHSFLLFVLLCLRFVIRR